MCLLEGGVEGGGMLADARDESKLRLGHGGGGGGGILASSIF